MTCEEIAAQLTRWADDELGAREREAVAAHLERCGMCHAQAEAERGARALLQARRETLRTTAPPALRSRIEGIAREASPARARMWRPRPLIAATLALVFSGATLHLATTRSATVLAAQLATDHVKCHLVERGHGPADPVAVQERLAVRYGFAATVPPGDARLRLIGARRCLTGEGTNAHILYTYEGRPLSLYLLPASQRPAADVEVLGQRAIVWARHNGTYVLVAGEGTPDLDRVARYMQTVTK